jgi:hypothetical protein
MLPVHPMAGPLIDAFVGVSMPRQVALTQSQQPVPSPERIRALIDTGASCTCVDPTVVTKLGLTPTGQMQMCTPSTGTTPHPANTYDVSIQIPCANGPALIFQTIAVASVQLLLPQGFHALIGRDVLKHCLLNYNGAIGLFTLAY